MTLPASNYFTNPDRTNAEAKQAQDDMLEVLRGLGGFPVAAATGTVDAITATFSPAITLADKTICTVVAAGANTSTTPSFAPNGLTANTITKQGGQALAAGDIPRAGFVALLQYDLANTRWELLNPAKGVTGTAEAIRHPFIPASAFTPTTTNGATKGSNEYATNDIMAEYLIFSGSTEQFACLNLAMPPEWDRGAIKAKFYWAPGDAACTAGDTVEWEIQGGALSDGDTIDAALGTAQVVSDTVLAGKNAALHISGATPAVTIGGSPALGDFIPLKISRNVSGTDDMAEVAWLFGLVLEYSVSNAVAAW